MLHRLASTAASRTVRSAAVRPRLISTAVGGSGLHAARNSSAFLLTAAGAAAAITTAAATTASVTCPPCATVRFHAVSSTIPSASSCCRSTRRPFARPFCRCADVYVCRVFRSYLLTGIESNRINSHKIQTYLPPSLPLPRSTILPESRQSRRTSTRRRGGWP